MYDLKAIRARILELIPHRGQAEFARKCGINPTLLNQILKGHAGLTLENALKICTAHNVRLEWLILGIGPMRPEGAYPPPGMGAKPEAKVKTSELPLDAAVKTLKDALARVERTEPHLILEVNEQVRTHMRDLGEPSEEFVPVPYMEERVAAGPPTEVADERIRGYIVMYKSKVKRPADTFAVQIRGNSMHPTIPDGAIVGVDASQRDVTTLLHSIVLAVDGKGGATVKRLRQDATHWILQPDNPEAETIYLDKLSIANPIVGKVIWFWCEVK